MKKLILLIFIILSGVYIGYNYEPIFSFVFVLALLCYAIATYLRKEAINIINEAPQLIGRFDFTIHKWAKNYSTYVEVFTDEIPSRKNRQVIRIIPKWYLLIYYAEKLEWLFYVIFIRGYVPPCRKYKMSYYTDRSMNSYYQSNIVNVNTEDHFIAFLRCFDNDLPPKLKKGILINGEQYNWKIYS